MNQRIVGAVAVVLLAGRAAGQDAVGPLLAAAKSAASAVRSDVATLDLVAESSQSRTTILNLYQDDIRAVRTQAARLDAARKNGTRWQQIASERVIPLMEELASAAEAAVRAASGNENPGKQYFKLSADLCGELTTLIGGWADYAHTKDELDRISGAHR